MLRKIAVLLSALAMMMFMAVPPAMAHHDVGHTNQSERGNKSDDLEDPNKGGGQEHTRNAKPPKGGGEKHGGGDGDNGGGNDGCGTC
jgi:hypothetical protein